MTDSDQKATAINGFQRRAPKQIRDQILERANPLGSNGT